MTAREWKARCPKEKLEPFIEYLFITGVEDAARIEGYAGSQIFTREVEGLCEVTLITYWDSVESIKAFAGDNIETARLYPDDFKFGLQPDGFVIHRNVIISDLHFDRKR